MNTETRFIEPLDVLYLRGNKLFGDAGSYGEALVPPWPSVAAGALRSRMMTDDPGLSADDLQNPDVFTLSAFHLARRVEGRVEPIFAPPADLVLATDDAGQLNVAALKPTCIAPSVLSSGGEAKLPVLPESKRSKPQQGYWLTQAGWDAYLRGQVPTTAQLLSSSDLWSLDARVGVGLDAETRRADDGKLFTAQAIAFKDGIGFFASARGRVPADGLIRLGGDGRAAAIHAVPDVNAPEVSGMAKEGRFKLVLTTPGVFSQGWMLPGVDENNILHLSGGMTAKLVCAAVPRAQTISGWDLARWEPKPAQRAAPTGSVYWFEDLQGDPAALGTLVDTGLWGLTGQADDPQRRAEGFNRCAIGEWS